MKIINVTLAIMVLLLTAMVYANSQSIDALSQASGFHSKAIILNTSSINRNLNTTEVCLVGTRDNLKLITGNLDLIENAHGGEGE